MKKEGPRGRYRRILADAICMLDSALYKSKITEVEAVLETTRIAHRSRNEHISQVALLGAALTDLSVFAVENGLSGLELFILEQSQVPKQNLVMQ